MSEQTIPELLPCPFCGGEAERFKGGPIYATIPWAICYGNGKHDTISMPVVAWNTRPNPPAVQAMPEGEVERLRGALRALEAACDDLAANRSRETYQQMVHLDRATPYLEALDDARREARAALTATSSDVVGQSSGASCGPGSREPSPAVSALTGFDPSRITLRMPTDVELAETCSLKWSRSGRFNIDQWPADVLALSIPTKFVPVTDFDESWRIFDGDTEVMGKYAALLDEAMGWSEHFIRMNSRSPKDAAYPGLPITCAGKQAIAWIASSERCADDTSLHQHAQKPFFICARERRPIRPAWEFRCFAKDGKVIAVSRYDYHNPSEIPEDSAPRIMEAARTFYARHLSRHYGDVVFDLHAPSTSEELLIELNPYGLSDPCLFQTYEAIEAEGGIRLCDSDEHRDGEDPKGLSGEAMPARAEGIAQEELSS